MNQSNLTKPDCFDVPEELTALSLARAHILDALTVRPATAKVNLHEAHGRILAQNLLAPADVPPVNNAAMDGFAVRSADLPEHGERSLAVAGIALAGKPFDGNVESGSCVRIMTGAAIPDGADTVIAQEHVIGDMEANPIVIDAGHKAGQNMRPRGEDLAAGDVVLKAGKRIGAAELGVLSSMGFDRVPVFEQLRVAVFSTGDELREPDVTLDHGLIHDCNRPILRALVTQLGCSLTDLGILPDQYEVVRDALAEAATDHDVIITSGGVSTGVADYVTRALQELGDLGVWRIALRPGRPFAHGRIGACEFFGLPGNPVAVMVTFDQLVNPALGTLAGLSPVDSPFRFRLPCTEALRKKTGRTEVYRAIMYREANGTLSVKSTGKQSSGLLKSMSDANCFILLEHDDESTSVGQLVDVIPFSD